MAFPGRKQSKQTLRNNANPVDHVAKTEIQTPFVTAVANTGVIGLIKDFIEESRNKAQIAATREIEVAEATGKIEEVREAALDRIEYLAPKDLRYLAECLREGNQSFFTYVHSPPVTTLMGKELVYTPGGTHHQDHYPFTIRDYVWKELLSRKDEILKKDEENKRDEHERKRRRR